MYQGQTVFAQLMQNLPWTTFRRIVDRYRGDRSGRGMRCSEQFRALAFAQVTGRESLRDLEACLGVAGPDLYHAGFRRPIRRSPLARANERHDWRIFAEFAQKLLARARQLYAGESLASDLASPVFALDSSTIDLCLSLFPWAPFRSSKAAIKLHTLLDLRGWIPSFIRITDGKVHDVRILDALRPEPGAVYVMDRAYVDFERLYRFQQSGAFFVVRSKKNLKLRRLHSHAKQPDCGIRADQTVVLGGQRTAAAYPERLRRIHFRDPATQKKLVFLTNRTDWPATTICDLYKRRWQIELWFKFVKQNLRVKRFLGTSENAVKSQLWVAITVLMAILRKQLGLEITLHTMIQKMSLKPFHRQDLRELLTDAPRQTATDAPAQLELFKDLAGNAPS